MIAKTSFSLYIKPLAVALTLAMVTSVHGAETTESSIVKNPWAFDLTVYAWMPSIDGNFSAGRFDTTTSPSFVNIMGKLRNFPMAFNGHFEAHYERLGFYLDGNYMGMDFRPHLDQRISKGISTRMGIMDYGASYRLFAPSASERVSNWDAKTRSNSFDVYAGGRTIWLGNEAEFTDIGSVSSNASVTAPVIGGRINVDISPKWFVLVDGSVGGFGVDNVNFTSSALGKIGYRTSLFCVPASVEAGYKALNVKVSKPVLTADITMHGPYIGLTGYW
jgi:hypothetical protein